MNRPLDAASIDALTVRFEDFVPTAHKGHGRHGKPFNKREEGRSRRKARKAKQASRFAWLNS